MWDHSKLIFDMTTIIVTNKIETMIFLKYW